MSNSQEPGDQTGDAAGGGAPRRQRIFNLPGVIVAIVAALIGIHLLRAALPPVQNLDLLQNFAFVPGRFTLHFAPDRIAEALAAAQAQGQFNGELARFFLGDGKVLWWTPLTYALLHASWLHLGFNCLWFVAFGAAVARRLGTLRFLLFCLATALAGALVHYLTHLTDLQPVIGASAIVSGTMAAVVRFAFQPGAALGDAPLGDEPGAPQTVAAVSPPPRLPLRAVLTDRRAMGFLIAWFGANLLFGIAPGLAGFPGVSVAWQAHIGGFLVGLFGFAFFDPPPLADESAKA